MKKMWIKIEEIQEEIEPTLVMEEFLRKKIGTKTTIQFGQREMNVSVNPSIKKRKSTGSFDDPFIFLCSKEVIDYLLIKTSNRYQLKIGDGYLKLGPVIGLLLGEQQYYYHHERMGEHTDAMCDYKNVGGIVFGFKTVSVDWEENCIYGLYFDHQDETWKYDKFPFPDVVYRRAFHMSEEVVNKLKGVTDGKVFNSRRFTKWELYEDLKQDEALINHLPETMELRTVDQVKRFLLSYKNIILKPINLSRGRGICIMQELGEDKVLISDYHDGTKLTQITVSTEEAIAYVKEQQFLEKAYIIQPYLELATINGAPWDIRVVMQKDHTENWSCHGIECRVAGFDDLVTNISRGGRALSITEAMQLSFGPSINAGKMKKKVIELAKRLSRSLEKEDDIFAELGIDLAMDVNQQIWIIESNVRPTYNGFRKHMEYQNYLHLCCSPVGFASSLAGFGKE